MNKIKYGDIIVLLFIIFFSLFYTKTLITDRSNKIIIDTYDKSYRYDLNTDKQIIVNGLLGKSVIIITNHKIMFKDAPCRDKLCIKSGILKNAPLICMPNGIVIRFEKNTDNNIKIDSIVQ